MASYIYPQDLGTAPWNQNHMVFKAREIIGAQGGAGNTHGTGMQPAFVPTILRVVKIIWLLFSGFTPKSSGYIYVAI